MNRFNIPNPSNGIKSFWDDIEFMLGIAGFDSSANNGGLIKYLEDLCVELNTDNFIITGCDLSGSDISEGFVFLDGEILKVPAHTKTGTHFVKSIENPTEGDRVDAEGTSISIYDQYIAKVTASSGSLEYNQDIRVKNLILNGYFSGYRSITLSSTQLTDSDKYISIGVVDDDAIIRMPVASDTNKGNVVLIDTNNYYQNNSPSELTLNIYDAPTGTNSLFSLAVPPAGYSYERHLVFVMSDGTNWRATSTKIISLEYLNHLFNNESTLRATDSDHGLIRLNSNYAATDSQHGLIDLSSNYAATDSQHGLIDLSASYAATDSQHGLIDLSASYAATDSQHGLIDLSASYAATEDQYGLVKSPLACKVLNIGNWDMQNNSAIPTPIAHGITNGSDKIKSIEAKIYNDIGSYVYPLHYINAAGTIGGGVYWGDTEIILSRSGSGFFDNSLYDDGTINRGELIIWYDPT